jgi:hypothetical protein
MKRAAWDPRRDLSQEALDALIRGASSAQHEAPDNLMRLLRDDPASPFRITREQQP